MSCTPVIAVLACPRAEAATRIASLVELARSFGGSAREEPVAPGCTALSVDLPEPGARRFQAALLLGGAALLHQEGVDRGRIAVIVTFGSPHPAES